MSDNKFPKLVLSDAIRYATRPTVSKLMDCTVQKMSHKSFTVTAPKAVLDYLWDQLYDSDAVVSLDKKTRFVVEVVVSPMADAEKLRATVMAYIFQIYLLSGEIAEYQEQKADEALAKFFSLPAQLATSVAEALQAQQQSEQAES